MLAYAAPGGITERLKTVAGLLGVQAGVGILVSYVAMGNPYHSGFFPGCPFLAVSGFHCPGCGGLRATHELLHGNVAGALDMNPVAVLVLIPLTALGLLWWTAAAAGLKVPRFRLSTTAALMLPIFLALFWVVRNIPALEPYLAP